MPGEYISPKDLAEQRKQIERQKIHESQLEARELKISRMSATKSCENIWSSIVNAGLPDMTTIEIASYRRQYSHRQPLRRVLQSILPTPIYIPESGSLTLRKAIQGYKIPDSDLELTYLEANTRAQQDSIYRQKTVSSVLTEDGLVGVRRKSKYYGTIVTTTGQVIDSNRNCIVAEGLDFMPLNRHPYPELLKVGLNDLASQLNITTAMNRDG